MKPMMLNTVVRAALTRYEARNGVHFADMGEHLMAWRRKEDQSQIYDEATEAALADKLLQMVDDWDIVISLALVETEALRALSFLGKPNSNPSPMFAAAARTIVEICGIQLGVGVNEGTLSQRYLLEMLRRAAPEEE